MRFECRAEVILCENLSLAPFELSWFDDIIEVGVTKKNMYFHGAMMPEILHMKIGDCEP